MTLVSSGNKASFISAMKYFGDAQNIKVRKEPEILNPNTWFGTYQPNQLPMWRWCRQYLSQCNTISCGDREGKYRIDLSEVRMDFSMLIGIDFHKADMHKSSLIRADLTESNLDEANLDESSGISQV